MTNFADLFEKEVDRKGFLLTVGLLFLALTGVTGILKSLAGITSPKAGKGYGYGTYGR